MENWYVLGCSVVPQQQTDLKQQNNENRETTTEAHGRMHTLWKTGTFLACPCIKGILLLKRGNVISILHTM